MTSQVMDTALRPLNTDPPNLVIRAHFSNGGHNMRRTTSIVIVLISLLTQIPSQAQSKSADIDAVKQVEQDMGRAMIAGDTSKLIQIYADDFAIFGSSGKMITKQDLVSDFESFHDKLEWYENGPIDVQVFGNVAVA